MDIRKRDEMAETEKAVTKSTTSVKKRGPEDTTELIKELNKDIEEYKKGADVISGNTKMGSGIYYYLRSQLHI